MPGATVQTSGGEWQMIVCDVVVGVTGATVVVVGALVGGVVVVGGIVVGATVVVGASVVVVGAAVVVVVGTIVVVVTTGLPAGAAGWLCHVDTTPVALTCVLPDISLMQVLGIGLLQMLPPKPMMLGGCDDDAKNVFPTMCTLVSVAV